MALHPALEALALGVADDVHFFPGLKNIDGDLIARLRRLIGVDPEFAQVAERREGGLLQVAELAGGQPFALAFGKPELNGGIAFLFLRPDLGNKTRPSFNDGDRDHASGIVKYLGHAQFFPD